MTAEENTEEPSQPSRTRRMMLAGGMVGVAAVAGSALSRAPSASATTTNPSITDWVNVVTDVTPGADPTGATDSASAIQAAINAAAALTNNGAVYFPTGTYLIESPLLLLPGVVLTGPHPYGQDYWAKAGAILSIGSSFALTTAQAGYPVLAAIVIFDKASLGASGSPDQCGIHNLLIEGTTVSGTVTPAGVDGIATYGNVGALHISQVALNNIAGNGIAGYRNTGTTPFPDGWTITDVGISNAGSNPVTTTTGLNGVGYQADGFQLAGNDHSLENIHCQSTGTAGSYGNGFNIAGSNIHASRLRAEVSGLDGFLWASLMGGGNWSGICFTNCTTQGNNNNGVRITNTSTSGQVLNNVAEFRGCRFEGDGVNGGSGGGGFAGVCVDGANIVTLSDCDVLVKTNTVSTGCPQWALATGTTGTSSGKPQLIQALGGFWSSVPGSGTVLWNDAAPARLLSVSVHGYFGTSLNPQPSGTTTPVIMQNNPL
jgi:Pectate lyase superfamily protein